MYHFKCICGENLALPAKEGECPFCKMDYKIDLFNDAVAGSGPLTATEICDAARRLADLEFPTDVLAGGYGAVSAIEKFADPKKVRDWLRKNSEKSERKA